MKKQLRIRLDTISGASIARSKAREVLRDAEKFHVIVMDYEHVPEIGQAFADEIYRVFKQKYPNIRIENEHMSGQVKFMVERAQNEAKASKNI